jgi:uncharacterized lipoprotein YddW (UPF0748 family)
VWLTFVGSTVFDSRENLELALRNIHAAGFDTVYPVVWNKGYTTFPSESLRRLAGVDLEPKLAGRDPLAEIIDANKRLGLGLAIIPWFEYGLKVVFGAAQDRSKPQPDRLKSTFPLAFKARAAGMLLKRQDGSDTFYDKGNGHFFGFLNPLDSRVRALLGGMASEVTNRYEVQGFQIDDHFSIHNEFGYNSDVLAAFDNHLQSKGLGRHSFGQQQDAAGLRVQAGLWNEFRAGMVNGLAKEMGEQLPRHRKGFVYQISPAGDIGFSYGVWLQNWRALVQDRVVQEFVLQAYRDQMGPFLSLINHSSVGVSRSRAAGQIAIFAGYKGDPRPASLLVSQIEAVRRKGMGVSVFFYDTLFTADAARLAAISQALKGPLN